MIIECKKRAEGYKPVKGNEKEIINHLLDHYENYSVNKDENRFDFEVNDELWEEEYFNNYEGYFVKLDDDGSITVSEGQPSFKDYVAMEFTLMGDFDWVKWLFKAQNINSLHKNQMDNISIKQWDIKPTPFQMQEGSILVFDKNNKTLHNVLNRTSVTIDEVLLENGYAVHGNSINQEIWALEKRLHKCITFEERMSIISRIRSLKNSKNEEG